MINLGDCFTLFTHGDYHLHIVIQEQRPGQDLGEVICVYICKTNGSRWVDPRTILHKGDHTFITEDCYVKYKNAKIELKSDLETRIVDRYESLRPDILEHIRSAFKSGSRYEKVLGKIFTFFNEWEIDRLMSSQDF